ncbi:hypothetical protein [Nonomuraea sediminis]|uniref:hypothetical protein n=1 Tax=Nonomuraea sediminis TaxID=2835864 RepID=UPI001BDC1A67|nr:hypothetical protein [Nonomuraea sediminis]
MFGLDVELTREGLNAVGHEISAGNTATADQRRDDVLENQPVVDPAMSTRCSSG